MSKQKYTYKFSNPGLKYLSFQQADRLYKILKIHFESKFYAVDEYIFLETTKRRDFDGKDKDLKLEISAFIEGYLAG